MQSKYTRTGARRSGDDYQDLAAADLFIEMLEHPARYKWVRLEADDAGALDDVVALRADGDLIAKQIKFSTSPEDDDDIVSWEWLLRERQGKKQLLPSFLSKWSSSLDLLRQQGPVAEACLITNRKPSQSLANQIFPNGAINFKKITDSKIRSEIVRQLGGLSRAHSFFGQFRFYLDRPGLDNLEAALQKRFFALSGTEQGWLNLKDEIRFWIRSPNQPQNDRSITLLAVRNAALWFQLQRIPQQFEVPSDYVLPSKDSHVAFVRELTALKKGCKVLTASPGVGKSTYLSYLFGQLSEKKTPIVRHHYFLSLSDRTVGRFDHLIVAESLMSDIQARYPEAIGSVGHRNPDPRELSTWIESCGHYFSTQAKALIIIIDGLDHVWREIGSVEEVRCLLDHLLPPPNGVVVLLGTQPLDETQLPVRLIQAAPKEQWINLPFLDIDATTAWLRRQSDELDLPTDEQSREYVLGNLSDVLYQKSAGHPLHMRLTIRALQEQHRPVTETTIKELPECPHKNIHEYYTLLWNGLLESGRQILHLFAACPFPWPPIGVGECLDPNSDRLPEIKVKLRGRY